MGKNMGLDIGMNVLKQYDGIMGLGYNPTTNRTIEEAEADFQDYLYRKFPGGGFGCSLELRDKEYQFYLWFSSWGRSFTANNPDKDIDDVEMAMVEWAMKNFGRHEEGLQIELYHAY